jgi:plastocyanin
VVVVEVRDFAYAPRSVTIQPGQTVRWVRRGNDTTHTVTAVGGEFDSGFAFAAAGATFERVFPASEDGETFEYSCTSHEASHGMRGSIRVGASAPDPDPRYE